MLGIVVAIAAISTSAILVRWSEAPNVVKAFYRMVFMTAAVAPFALALLGEIPEPVTILGGIVVLLGIFVTSRVGTT